MCVSVLNTIILPINEFKLADVYSMQLSNQPAEALAQKLINISQGAFALCGFASGGSPYKPQTLSPNIMNSQGLRLWMGP